MIRSFLAFEIPSEILKKIGEVQEDLKSSHADVRWVSPEKIHLTLKFFGNIDEPRIEPIIQSIDGLIRVTSPIPLKVRGVGAFPHLKNPRVIWVGLVDGKAALIDLQKQLERELEKIGFESEDRAFHPHLTLGRMKSSKGKEGLVGMMTRYQEEEFGDFQAERIILFKSDLRPTGPIYTALREIRLEGE